MPKRAAADTTIDAPDAPQMFPDADAPAADATTPDETNAPAAPKRPPVRFTIEAPALRKALAVVGGAVKRTTPKPILSNVLLTRSAGGNTTLYATDLEVGIRLTLQVPSADDDVRVLLPYHRFSEIVARAKDETLELETNGESMVVRGKRFELDLPLDDPDTYPEPFEEPDTGWHRADAADLTTAIKRTAYAADVESTKYALGGILLVLGEADVTAVGCDGRRMSLYKFPAERVGGGGLEKAKEGVQPVVPLRTLAVIAKSLPTDDGALAEVAVLHDKAVFIRAGGVRMYSRLVEGRFPRYQDVIPSRKNANAVLTFAAGELAGALEMARLTTSDESVGVDFDLAPGTLALRAQAADRGKSRASLDATGYEGKPFSWTMNPDYVLQMLNSLDAAELIDVYAIDGKNAIMFRPHEDAGDREFVYVVMPLTRDR